MAPRAGKQVWEIRLKNQCVTYIVADATVLEDQVYSYAYSQALGEILNVKRVGAVLAIMEHTGTWPDIDQRRTILECRD